MTAWLAPFNLVAHGFGAVHVDDEPPLIDVAHRERAGRTPGRVVVDVFGETLHGHVGDRGDDVEMVPVHVTVEHGHHFAARFEDIAQTFALGDTADMGR